MIEIDKHKQEKNTQTWYEIEASVTDSFCTGTPSFASTAWWRPSDQRRPGIVRPVNSSTMTTSPPRTMYDTSRRKSSLAFTALITKEAHCSRGS